jgi:hypothetical protein
MLKKSELTPPHPPGIGCKAIHVIPCSKVIFFKWYWWDKKRIKHLSQISLITPPNFKGFPLTTLVLTFYSSAKLINLLICSKFNFFVVLFFLFPFVSNMYHQSHPSPSTGVNICQQKYQLPFLAPFYLTFKWWSSSGLNLSSSDSILLV